MKLLYVIVCAVLCGAVTAATVSSILTKKSSPVIDSLQEISNQQQEINNLQDSMLIENMLYNAYVKGAIFEGLVFTKGDTTEYSWKHIKPGYDSSIHQIIH